MRKNIPYSLVLMILTILGCTKQHDTGGVLKLKLTDAPYKAQQVNVEIQGIKVRFQGQEGSTDGKDWVWLNTRSGVYDLLKLQNGVETDLASGAIPNGRVLEIKFVLGSNNSVKMDNKFFPLSLPENDGSGYTLLANRRMNGTLDSLTIDFDAGRSVQMTSYGIFKMSPVLQVVQ